MQTNHKIPQAIVIRSRFLSTTDDDPSDDDIPPPNRSDRPPPLPLCSSTSRTMSRLVMIRTMENAITTAVVVPPGAPSPRRLLITTDPDESLVIEARAADQRAVDIWLRHDGWHVVGFH
jgi:hypothetical protein